MLGVSPLLQCNIREIETHTQAMEAATHHMNAEVTHVELGCNLFNCGDHCGRLGAFWGRGDGNEHRLHIIRHLRHSGHCGVLDGTKTRGLR